MGRGLNRSRNGEALPGGRSQTVPDVLRDVARDIVLEVENVPVIALIALGPDVAVGGRLHQSHRDADASVRTQDRTFHHGIDVQFFRDRTQRFARVLVVHRRSA